MDKVRHTNKIFSDTSKSYVEWYFHSAKFGTWWEAIILAGDGHIPNKGLLFSCFLVIKNNVASQPRAILIIIAPLVVAQLTWPELKHF